MRVLIIAAGELDPNSPAPWQPGNNDRSRWEGWDLVICADGGAALAQSWGLVPELVVGDMDSLQDAVKTALETQGSRFAVHPRAKDETDLELALDYATKLGAQEIVILGALGGRLDHTLANVLLLAAPRWQGVNIRIVDGDQEVMLVRSGESLALQGREGDLVSLLPVSGDVQGIVTTGLAWPLLDEGLRFGYTRGISNVMTNSVASVCVIEGLLLLVHRTARGREAPGTGG